MSRKIKILLAVVILMFLGFGVWYFFFNNPNSPISQTINSILPFGNGGGNLPIGQGNGGNNATGTPTTSGGKTLPRLFKISDAPVAGAVSFLKGGLPAVRYVDRATGHIFDVSLSTLEKKQITNNTLPKIYEADWKKDASSVVVRSLGSDGETVNNLSLLLTAPKSTSTDALYALQATALRGNMGEVVAGTGDNIFYNLKDTGTVDSASFRGDKTRVLFISSFNEWRLGVSGTNLLLTTKVAAGVSGFSYLLNTGSLSLKKLLGPLDALTATSNSKGTRLAYFYNQGQRDVLIAKNLAKGSSIEITPTSLTEKCLWSEKHDSILFCASPIGGVALGEPDLWYQGVSHYTDRLWKFDTDTNFTTLLAEPKKDFGFDIDAMNLTLSPDEDYLIFTNKNDLSLWALKL